MMRFLKEHALEIGLAAVLVVGIFAIYGQTAAFENLRLDDHDYTFACPFVRDGLSFANVCTAFRDFVHGCIWMPLTYISYMCVISVCGNSPGAQHLVCAAIHAVNAVLFLALLLRLVPASRRGRDATILCFFACAFWAWHSMRCESVAWIASRKDVMFTLFTLWGLLAWASKRWISGVVLCALGCMCKPTAMVFPCLAFCVELLQMGKYELKRPSGRTCLSYAVRYLPLFVIGGLTGLLAMYSQTDGGSRGLFYTSLGWRVLNAVVSLGLEIWQTVIPAGMHIVYRPKLGEWPLHATKGILVFVAVAAVSGYALWRVCASRLKDTRWVVYLICAFWFMISVGPTLGIAASFGDHAYADRFTYVPAMGLSMLVLMLFCGPKPSWRVGPGLVCGCGAALVAYAVAATSYAGTFRNNFVLFTRVVEHDWSHPAANLIVGIEYAIRLGEVDKGVEYVRRSFLLEQKEETAAELVYLLAKRGRPEDDAEVKGICGILNDQPERDAAGRANEALAIVAMREGRLEDAKRQLANALRVGRPDTRSRAAKMLAEVEQRMTGPRQ